MMIQFSVKNYKKLKDLRINGLRRLNLVVGENNACKSSLLEAIALYTANGGERCVHEILEMRGDVSRVKEEGAKAYSLMMDGLASLYADWNLQGLFDEGITFAAAGEDNHPQEMTMRLQKRQLISAKSPDGTVSVNRIPVDAKTPMDDSVSVWMEAKRGRDTYSWAADLAFGNFDPMVGNKGYEFVRTAQLSTCRDAELFDNVSLTEMEGEIVNALKIIDDRIERINFLKEPFSARDESRIPFVVLKGDARKHRLSSMGDGMKRVLTIVLSLLNCRGGVLLIDEFENGLHYSVQTQLWQMIAALAEKLNVQVFATTHSNDCIRSFAETVGESGSIVRLQEQRGKMVAVNFAEMSRVRFALNNEIEIR